MNRANVLAALNSKMLEVYSLRTTDQLRSALPLRIALPRLEPFLALNLAKEVQKDALVIRGGGVALAAGDPPGSDTSRRMYEATKAIDDEFLARLGSFPVGIVIRYEEIAPIRTRRIDCLLAAAYRIFDAWRGVRGCRAAILSAYSRAEFERLLHELLRLYAQETRALSRSLRLPALLVPLRERLALSLYDIMNDTASRLAGEMAGAVYRSARV